MQTAFGITVLVWLVAATAEAQAPAITAGTRVRVTSRVHDYNRKVATVNELRGDSVVLVAGSRPVTMALSDLDQIQVSVGRRRTVLRGMLAGGLIGAVGGAVIGAVTYQPCEGFCLFVPDNAAEAGVLTGTVLGVVGVAVGGIVGAFNTTDRWGPATAPGRISLAPAPGGRVAVGLTRSF